MTILVISSWTVKPEKQAEFNRMWKRLLKYMKKKLKILKEVKSLKFYTQTFGGVTGSYVQLTEYGSLAAYETVQTRMIKDKEAMKLNQEFMLLVDPTTITENVLTAIK